MKLGAVDHVAIICSDYERSKRFYIEVLGGAVIAEILRPERQSMKLDLRVGTNTTLELFSFPNPPERLTEPEACGLRHLAFVVDDLDAALKHLALHEVQHEEVRHDALRGNRFVFFKDPDGLPIELCEHKKV